MPSELTRQHSPRPLWADTPQAGADLRLGDSPEVLAQVRQPGVSLGLWQRTPDAELAEYLARSLSVGYRLDRYEPGDTIDVPAFIDQALPAGGAEAQADAGLRERFSADVQQLVARFRALRPESTSHILHLRLAVVERADCPVLHTDWVTLRMICTYVGAGCEYAAAYAVNRAALCRPLGSPAATNAAILRDPLGLRRMPTFSVGLMKGNGYPGQEGGGLVHRSPPPVVGRRIKLIVDSTLPPEEKDA